MIALRALEPEDLDLLCTIENDPDMWDVGTTATPYSRHALRQHIRAMGADITECGELRLVICQDTTPVGLVDLTSYNARAQRAEVSIALLAAYRHQGIGKAALQALEAHCRRYTHLHQLYAIVGDNNKNSQTLFESCGYVRAAELRDWHFANGMYQNAVLYQHFL